MLLTKSLVECCPLLVLGLNGLKMETWTVVQKEDGTSFAYFTHQGCDETERKAFEKALVRRNRHLAVLNDIAETINRSLDLHTVLDIAAASRPRKQDLIGKPQANPRRRHERPRWTKTLKTLKKVYLQKIAKSASSAGLWRCSNIVETIPRPRR